MADMEDRLLEALQRKLGSEPVRVAVGNSPSNFDAAKLETSLNTWIEKVEEHLNEIEERVVERPSYDQLKRELERERLTTEKMYQEIARMASGAEKTSARLAEDTF